MNDILRNPLKDRRITKADHMLTVTEPSTIHETDVWVIGDVHGCGNEYEQILKKIFAHNEKADVYQLGDLIDRGPDLLRVFELTHQYGVKTLLGNHELNFLQERLGGKTCRSKARADTHRKFDDCTESEQEFILDIMASSVVKKGVYIFDTRENWVLSHSPIKSKTGFSASDYCMNGQKDESLYPSRGAHGHMHWDYKHIGTQLLDPDRRVFNVDGGCVYGDDLIALNLKTYEFLTVQGVAYSSENE